MGNYNAKILADGSNIAWGYKSNPNLNLGYNGGSALYDHVSNAHVFFSCERDYTGQEGYLVVRKANTADGSTVFDKGYQDSKTTTGDALDLPKPCVLNSAEHLFCSHPKNLGADLGVYKLDGSDQGQPLAGAYLSAPTAIIGYEYFTVGADDRLYSHLEASGGTKLFVIFDSDLGLVD